MRSLVKGLVRLHSVPEKLQVVPGKKVPFRRTMTSPKFTSLSRWKTP